jgi:EAL domain-containing protein (putative c-di-GMP-specific phosphodiesterase class I)
MARHQSASEHEVRQRLLIAHDLRRALHDRELAVYYQPQVDIATRRPVGVEALVRWLHPERGVIPPDEFISIAEHTGLIDALTDFVLSTALQQRKAWVEDLMISMRMAVNVSPSSFSDPTFAERVARNLIRHDCPASALTIEITESQLMADPHRAAAVLGDLQDLGVSISIDDFGTGFSSLTSLRSLPLDEVKIDKSFVFEVPASESDAVIVRSMAGLAQNLGLTTVAEGVENDESLAFLSHIGVEIAQGYFFAKPMPAVGATRWLHARTAESHINDLSV